MTAGEHEQRIQQEERTWNAPKMFVLGFAFLGLCLAVIFAMAYSSSPDAYSMNPFR